MQRHARLREAIGYRLPTGLKYGIPSQCNRMCARYDLHTCRSAGAFFDWEEFGSASPNDTFVPGGVAALAADGGWS